MAIGQSKLHELFDRNNKISDVMAWFVAFEGRITEKLITDWIRIDQLKTDKVNSKGNHIGLYSAATEALRPEKVEGTPFTLDWTGDFYRSINYIVSTNSITFTANGNKAGVSPYSGKFERANLFEKYGEEIIGLTEENKYKLKKLLKRKYIEYIKQILLRP